MMKSKKNMPTSSNRKNGQKVSPPEIMKAYRLVAKKTFQQFRKTFELLGNSEQLAK